MDVEEIRDRVRTICMALPGTIERPPVNGHSTWLFGEKQKYVYFLVNHHGDGITGINFRGLPGAQQALIDVDPSRFYVPSYVGRYGWVGMRLDIEPVDWEQVAGLLEDAYSLAAPKKKARVAKA